MDTLEERFAAADKKSQALIEEYVAGGFIKTLAQLLVYLDEEHAKAAMQKLPGDVKEKIEQFLSAELADAKRTNPEIIVEAARVHKNAGCYGRAMADEVIAGLSLSELSKINSCYDECFEKNPLLAMNVEYFSFTFEDILLLDDRSIQKVLREIDNIDLATALKGAGGEVQERIFCNMSQRAATMLREDMEFMGPARKCDIEEAQVKIVKTIRRLEKDGDIVIGKPAFLNLHEDPLNTIA